MIYIKEFKVDKNKASNLKINNKLGNSNVDTEYRNSDELANKNSYMKYELNNTFNDKNKKISNNDKNFK